MRALVDLRSCCCASCSECVPRGATQPGSTWSWMTLLAAKSGFDWRRLVMLQAGMHLLSILLSCTACARLLYCCQPVISSCWNAPWPDQHTSQDSCAVSIYAFYQTAYELRDARDISTHLSLLLQVLPLEAPGPKQRGQIPAAELPRQLCAFWTPSCRQHIMQAAHKLSVPGPFACKQC